MAAKSPSPDWWIHFSTWRARNGFSPELGEEPARPAASRSRRLRFNG